MADVPGLGAVPSDDAIRKDLCTKFDVAWCSADGADTWRVADLVVISPDRSDIRTKKYAEGDATRAAQRDKVAHYRHRIRNFDRIRPRILIAAFDVYGRLGDELNRVRAAGASRRLHHRHR